MKDWVILTLNNPAHLNMSNVENDLDIYYAVGNANTQRQENEIAAIIKKGILLDGNWSQQVQQS